MTEKEKEQIDALNVCAENNLTFLIHGVKMKIVNVAPRKGVTRANETIVHVHLKSEADESFMLLTGAPEWVIGVIGNAK